MLSIRVLRMGRGRLLHPSLPPLLTGRTQRRRVQNDAIHRASAPADDVVPRTEGWRWQCPQIPICLRRCQQQPLLSLLLKPVERQVERGHHTAEKPLSTTLLLRRLAAKCNPCGGGRGGRGLP